ncbi:MAG: long-chain fatty acid--CoA ligase [Deltaproteobacteria bacterium]|nr:long-chain fatty acid--CoA ligase [Deltaproteobacteria bacterium]
MTDTIVSMMRRQVIGNGDRPALETRVSGRWIARTFSEWQETALAIAAALSDLGVGHGDRVAILANTRREWAEVDLGIVFAGAVVVPIYQQTTPDGIAHIVKDSGSVVLFAEDPLQVEKLFDPAIQSALRGLTRIVYFDPRRKLDRPDKRGRLELRMDDVVSREERSRVMSFAELLEAGRRLLTRDDTAVRALGDAVTPDDLATIVYTSGTTGLPKGVELTHRAFAYETSHIREQVALTSSDRTLLFLPLAHIFAKLLLMGAVRVGYATAFATSLTTVLDELREVEPTFFGAVPRVFEKVHAGVMQKIRDESPVRRAVAERALAVGREVSERKRAGRGISPVLALKQRAADLAVLERIRHAFGRKLRFAVSGGAPLSPEISVFFHGVGVQILEAYGLTETCGATHINRPDAFKFGTVGQPIPGLHTKLADDGEVLVRGENLMRGYHNQTEATADVLSDDGWFATGDVGTIDHEGYLTITDRKKDLIVTAGGKNVAPQWIEGLLKQEPVISQAVVVGDRRPYLVALVTLDEAEVTAMAAREGVSIAGAVLREIPWVVREVEQAIRRVNDKLEQYQQVKRHAVLARDFTVEAGELTASLKVRRKSVEGIYREAIEGLYAPRG